MSNVIRNKLTSILWYRVCFFLSCFFRGLTGHGRENLCADWPCGSLAFCIVGTRCWVFSEAVMVQPQFGHVSTVLNVHVPHAWHLRICPRIDVLQCGHVSAMFEVFCPHPGHLIMGMV